MKHRLTGFATSSERVLTGPQAYVDMRKIGSGRGMVSAYPRQLESLIRLAEAHAKVRFSEKVESIDVEEAKRLHREALKQSATDPRTGFVDISILTTGTWVTVFQVTVAVGALLFTGVHV